MSKPKDYDTTVARIAGNIIGHLLTRETSDAAGQSYGFAPSVRDVTDAVAAARAALESVRVELEDQPGDDDRVARVLALAKVDEVLPPSPSREP